MKTPSNEKHAVGRSELSDELDPFTPEPRPSHAALLALIGEIDGIDLETEGYGVAVYLHIGDKKLRIIYGGGEIISHHITRTGIAHCIGANEAVEKVSTYPHPAVNQNKYQGRRRERFWRSKWRATNTSTPARAF